MNAATRQRGIASPRAGFAVLSVLFVLLALLFLCIPFLLTSRNASSASTQLSDSAQSRLALEAGVRHARANLGFSHPSSDVTPYFDDLAELSVEGALPVEFWNHHDPRGVMWDVEAADVAGRIDVGSAPPQVFANLTGAITRVSEAVKANAKQITVLSTAGFRPEGFVFVGSELVRYTTISDGKLSGLTRGLAARVDEKGNWLGCGPSPATDHAIGTAVIDQRAFAVPMWRIADAAAGLRVFDAIEEVRDATPLAMSGDLGEGFSDALEDNTSVYGGVRGGRVWQRAVRVTNALRANEDCVVRVAERRNFNPGTTVCLNDGRNIEFAIVQALVDRDGVRLTAPVKIEYLAYQATIAPLARRPVNVNVAPASVLHALFANLQLSGRSNRITRDEAATLAALCIESRPFTGLEDLLRRVVLPAAGVEPLPEDAPVKPALLAGGTAELIDVDDALAFYANALNANDERLAYSTMPLSFVSRDVYRIEARAAVHAESGVRRAGGLREEVALIVPQRDLMQVWARQEDFEESLRLDGEAPFWATGPSATSRPDGFSVPPSRLFAHWGTWKDQPFIPGRTKLEPDEVPRPEHVFASREDRGWTQLMPVRVEENGFTNGRMLHFDHETRDLEGRYLPDEPISYVPGDPKVQWAQPLGGLSRPMQASFWVKPRALVDGTFVDFGNGALDTDRIWLGIEGPDLVLRVIDGPGDHPGSVFEEFGEARFALQPGEGPGLAVDTWSHIEIDVRGNRPDQISLAVDGRRFGVRTRGLTRLSSDFPVDAIVFTVEDGEGFPDRGVARIGNELVEYVKQSPTTFAARHETIGPNAGFGGRLARYPFTLSATAGVAPGTNAAKGNVLESHLAGTPVQLYGYSLPLRSNVPFGEGSLTEAIGRFAVAIVDSVEVGGSPSPGEPIDLPGLFNPNIGLGMEGLTSQVTALVLRPADPAPMTTNTVMQAFQPTGGYALLMQLAPLNVQGLPPGNPITTVNQTPVFGTEVIHYSGWNGDRLLIDRRAALPSENNDTRPHAFVTQWRFTLNGQNVTSLDREIFVVPISINVGNTAAFLPPAATNQSEFAQITELGAGEKTEWVRYDRIEGNSLVRSDPVWLGHCRARVIGDPRGDLNPPVPPPPGGGGPMMPMLLSPPPAPPAAASAQVGSNLSAWQTYLGVDEDVDAPVTRTARTALQFRGVLGTYSHAHGQATPVHPVWRVNPGDADSGLPGHGDFAFLIDALPNDPGFPTQIHRAYRPTQYMEWSWVLSPDPTVAANGVALANPIPQESGFDTNAIYVAANAALTAPIAAGSSIPNASVVETRYLARLSVFPSGERPRDVTRVEIGRAQDGSGVPSAVIDELTFGTPRYGDGSQQGEAALGGQLSLRVGFGPGAPAMRTLPKTVRLPIGLYSDTRTFLDDLPDDAGLMRVGSEIVCYDSVDTSNGFLTLANGGRGLLGTTEETHELGESMTYLENYVVTTLSGQLTATASSIPIEDPSDFPSQGTVLIGGELIHYTHLTGALLEMPRASGKPGAMDGNGNGLFRGRFGTTPSAHAAGEPVILFPFRYWDRWADRADAPELSYFGLSIDQPNAYWRGVFFQVEEPEGVKIEVLQRSSPLVPWDAEPGSGVAAGLTRLEQGTRDGDSLPIGVQRDMLEWRAYVRFAPRAFDFDLGTSHGWKRTPRLTTFGVEYLGPGLTLRRVDE